MSELNAEKTSLFTGCLFLKSNIICCLMCNSAIEMVCNLMESFLRPLRPVMDPQKDYHAGEESGSTLGQLIHLLRTVTLWGYWNSQIYFSQSTSLWRQSTHYEILDSGSASLASL
jgi:hypothetical protein